MSNPITGDFDAVLQVSGSTINRLLATMHQNAFADPKPPSFPHTIRMRIGDDHPIDGVRGLVHGQIGVPRVELIHGVTDRFILEVGVRAWYRADAGSTPLPAFINGTVRAEYRFENIDPNCRGWSSTLASQYLWVRVVKESVRFAGTTAEDRSAIDEFVQVTAGADAVDAANVAKVETQIAGLLARRFEATPHPIKPGFRRDLLRSLNPPAGHSAVAVAIGLRDDSPSGKISSVFNVILGEADLGIGISIGYILSLARPFLDQVSQFHPTIPFHKDLPLKDFDTVYRVQVDPPSVEWEPHGWYGLIKVKAHGTAKTDSVAADASFDVEQHVILQFDATRGSLVATPAAPIVTASASGLYNGKVSQATRDAVVANVNAMAKAATDSIQPILDGIPARLGPLIDQLKTLDPQVSIGLTEGQFLRDGVVILGTVALSSRSRPVVKHERLPPLDGHTALDSWIPGGRIDRFEWSWTWTVSSIPGGHTTFGDRFVLRRPAGRASRWGLKTEVETPLPGLDGWGSVCLTIKGVQVDAVTGALVPVQSSRVCKRFGFNISDRVSKEGRLFLRDGAEASKDVPAPQRSLLRVGDAHVESEAANTLVMFARERWNEEMASVLRGGLETCARYDAGLALLILFHESILETGGARALAAVERFAHDAGIPAIVNEDVNGSWSRALGVGDGGGGSGWALLSPQGAVTWRHEGRLSAGMLAKALDAHLHRSPDASPAAAREGLQIGSAVAVGALNSGVIEVVESHCPPLPFGRDRLDNSVVTFVQGSATSSRAHLRQLYADYSQSDSRPPLVVVVVDGANARDARSLNDALGIDFVMVPDPTGVIADRFGVAVWPTTVTVDDAGTVSRIETGAGLRRESCQEPVEAV